jgi:3-hydroxyacyl-CoA dehydrogenase/enoyl-CoA hydratase/3-hydroxybutyryl-CoA epimerase
LTVDLAAEHVGSADIVIEAIVENVEAKRALFRDVDAKLPAAALVATNTSSIKLEELSDAFARPRAFRGPALLQPGREPAARRGHPARHDERPRRSRKRCRS